MKTAIDDSIYSISTLKDDLKLGVKSDEFFPFSQLYNQDYIEEKQVPRTPILISRSSRSITLKLPPFNPLVPELLVLEDPNRKIIQTMSLYGKVSSNGVAVSVKSTELEMTGIRNNLASVITIGNLIPNEKYCFACAAFNGNEEIANGIGETTIDITTVNPHSIPYIFGQLSKICYQIGYYEYAEKAAEKAIECYIEKTGIKDIWLQGDSKSLSKFKFKKGILENVSSLELAVLAETFLIYAKCLRIRFKQETENSKIKKNIIEDEKNRLLICNFLLLGLETSNGSKSPIMMRKLALELYNCCVFLLEMKHLTFYLALILSKIHVVLSDIPQKYWDTKLKEIAVKIVYYAVMLATQENELLFAKRVLYGTTKLPIREYVEVRKLEMVPEEIGTGNKGKKDSKKGSENRPESSERKLIPRIKKSLEKQENLLIYLEESLLSFSEELWEFVTEFIEEAKAMIDASQESVEDKESLEGLKESLETHYNIWESFRDLPNAHSKLLSIKDSPFFREAFAKLIRRKLDLNFDVKSILDNLGQIPEVFTIDSSYTSFIELKREAVTFNIAWRPETLVELKKEADKFKLKEVKAIEIFTKFLKIEDELNTLVASPSFSSDYLWRAEIHFCKAITVFREGKKETQFVSVDSPLDISKLELEKFKADVKELEVQAEKVVLLPNFPSIISNLATAALYGCEAKAWSHVRNTFHTLFNVLTHHSVTPFSHKGTLVYEFSIIGDVIIEFLRKRRGRPVAFDTLLTEFSKDIWFLNDKENCSDVSIVSSLASYIVQTLSIEGKSNLLIDFIQKFCNVTTHYYSRALLPFLISSYKSLFDEAHAKTLDKITALKTRSEEFEEWKAKSKKRKNRQALLTGEIPPEELAFQKDSAQIKDQIADLQSLEDRIKEKEEIGRRVLSELLQESNQAIEAQIQCHRMVERYGEEETAILKFEAENGDQNIIKKRKRAQNNFFQTLKNRLTSAIEQLSNRKEIEAWVMALNDFGDLCFASESYSSSFEHWSNALDTVFQRPKVLKGFRKFLIEHQPQFLCLHYSPTLCQMAIVILYKLAICYTPKLAIGIGLRDCLIFSAEIGKAFFLDSLQYPHSLNYLANYKLRDFPLLEYPSAVALYKACIHLAIALHDFQEEEKAIPLLAIAEFLSSEVLFSLPSLIKVYCVKAAVLGRLGLIPQAIETLYLASSQKGFLGFDTRKSMFLEAEKGKNSFFKGKLFQLNLNPYEEANKLAVADFLKIEVPEWEYSSFFSAFFLYSKFTILFSLYENEVYEKAETNDHRIAQLRIGEEYLRKGLKMMGEADLDKEEFGMNCVESRIENFELMTRMRMCLFYVNNKLKNNTKAFYILKKCVAVHEALLFKFPLPIEDGDESENQRQPEESKDKKKPGKAEPKKDDKKGGKAEPKAEESKPSELSPEEKQILRKKVEDNRKRSHPNGLWWMLIKLEYAKLLFDENKLIQAIGICDELLREAGFLNDELITRCCYEVKAKALFKQGDINSAKGLFHEAVNIGLLNSHSDQVFLKSLGDYSELLYLQGEFKEAVEILKQAKILLSQKHREQCFNFGLKDDNENSYSIADEFLSTNDVFQEINRKGDRIKMVKKDEKKAPPKKELGKAKAAAQAASEQIPVKELNPLSYISPSNPSRLISFKDSELYPANNNCQPFNAFNKWIELTLRIEIRLAECELLGKVISLDFLETLNSTIQRIDRMMGKAFNIPVSLLLQVSYLLGRIGKLMFFERMKSQVDKYTKEYESNKDKRFKRLVVRCPAKDIPRNKYLLEIPGYNKFLKESLIPDLLSAKEHFKRCLEIVKGDCILYEFAISVEEILAENSELISLLREYRPRVGYKNVFEEIKMEDHLEALEKADLLDRKNLEMFHFSVIQASSCSNGILS